jgi:hypothetical protein
MTTQRKAVPVRVLCIIDGDTVEVDQPAHRGWLKVRLLGIDAPEMDQPGGWDATLKLQELLTGDDDIMLETVAFDRYGRAVGLLYWRDRGRQQSVNLGMVHSGHAFCSTYDRGGPRWSGWGFTPPSATPARTGAAFGPGATTRCGLGNTAGRAGSNTLPLTASPLLAER